MRRGCASRGTPEILTGPEQIHLCRGDLCNGAKMVAGGGDHGRRAIWQKNIVQATLMETKLVA